MTDFVKASTTVVSPGRSQVELERILRRYGASGFGVQSDYEARIIKVMFRVPDEPGSTASVPVRLEVSVEAVARAMGMFKPPQSWQAERKPSTQQWERAERVAWRHLVLWVDAALSAATAGVQKISEAFLAHTLVRNEQGQIMRVVEQMDAAAGGNWRALLPAPTQEVSQ